MPEITELLRPFGSSAKIRILAALKCYAMQSTRAFELFLTVSCLRKSVEGFSFILFHLYHNCYFIKA